MGKTSNAAKDRYNAKAYDDIRLISEAMGVNKTTEIAEDI